MAAELHSVNYITHHLERLPLVDSYTQDKFSSLFCYHNFNEPHEKGSRYFTTKGINFTRRENANRYCNRSFLNENKSKRPDISHENLDNKNRRPDVSLESIPQIKQVCGETTGKRSSFEIYRDEPVFDSNRCVALTNKRKRSTDSAAGSAESDRSSCDEEINQLGLNENNIFNIESINMKVDSHSFSEDRLNIPSPSFKRKPLHASQREQKRPKNRPALNFDIMQRRSSSSTSWLPFKIRSSERKVKIIKVTPFDMNAQLQAGANGGRSREEVYFRPITLDER